MEIHIILGMRTQKEIKTIMSFKIILKTDVEIVLKWGLLRAMWNMENLAPVWAGSQVALFGGIQKRYRKRTLKKHIQKTLILVALECPWGAPK